MSKIDLYKGDCLDIVAVSLFDGLSGGRIALERTPHLNVLRYYSSEVDKYSIQVADKNYPQDTPYRLGSVVDIDGSKLLSEIRTEFGDVKIMLIGGSPCQGFSMAGKLKGSSTKCGKDVVTLNQYLTLKEMNFEFDGQSYLFWEYVRIMHELKPDYFMLENVRITKKWLPMFNEAIGVDVVTVNSALVSAQNRVRMYWTNIPNFVMPEDKGILLKDILESDVPGTYNLSDKANERCKNNKRSRAFAPGQEKSGALLANQAKQSTDALYAIIDKSVKPSVAKNIERDNEEILKSDKDFFTMNATSGFQDNKIGLKKSPCLRAGNNCTYALDDITYRKLTVLECERLQTLPSNYTEGVSNSQRYKMIGNGWTIDIPAYIFSFIAKNHIEDTAVKKG